jgi:TonB family protein
MRLPIFLSVLLLLAGCYTSQVAPDTVERANEHFARVESSGVPTTSEEEKQRLAHLFADRPEYVALVTRDEKGAALPRLRSSVPPRYPFGAYVSDTKALVKVAFVLSERGTVEEARVLEASDARFSTAAIDAVRAWTFSPGTQGGAPAKFLIVVPIQFDGRQK